jgi:zinc protease
MTTRMQSFPGPDDITRVILPNGITVLARSNFNSPAVVIAGYLTAGGLFDTDEKLGLANFTATGLNRGTSSHSFQQIFNSLESVGASLSFGAGQHSMGFSGQSLSEDLPTLLELLTDLLLNPIFPVSEVERLRTMIQTDLAERAQDTAEMASITFDQIVFAGHPYARPEDGWPETIQAIRNDDIVEFHRNRYGPSGMVICIVGGINPAEAVDQVTNSLGSWQNPDQTPLPALPALQSLHENITRTVNIPGKSQANLVIGASGPARKDPDYIADSLGNSVLGQFGMGGRIADVIREKSGLAYYASSSLTSGLGPGSWSIHAGVNPGNIEKTRDLILKEIERFVAEEVTPEELADSQSNFIGRLPLSLESNIGVAHALLNIERFDLGLDYYHRYPDMVRAVTTAQILSSARKFLDPRRLAIAIARP